MLSPQLTPKSPGTAIQVHTAHPLHPAGNSPWSPAPNSTPGTLCSLILSPGNHFLTLACMHTSRPTFCLSANISILCTLYNSLGLVILILPQHSFLVNYNPFICPISSPIKLSAKVTSNLLMAKPRCHCSCCLRPFLPWLLRIVYAACSPH